MSDWADDTNAIEASHARSTRGKTIGRDMNTPAFTGENYVRREPLCQELPKLYNWITGLGFWGAVKVSACNDFVDIIIPL